MTKLYNITHKVSGCEVKVAIVSSRFDKAVKASIAEAKKKVGESFKNKITNNSIVYLEAKSVIIEE